MSCRSPRNAAPCKGARLGVLRVDVTPLSPRARGRVSEMEGEDYTEPKGDAAKVLVETGCAH